MGKTQSDIRAYAGIDQVLDFVILGAAMFEHPDGTIQTEVTRESIGQLAAQAGYTAAKIKYMISCLDK